MCQEQDTPQALCTKRPFPREPRSNTEPSQGGSVADVSLWSLTRRHRLCSSKTRVFSQFWERKPDARFWVIWGISFGIQRATGASHRRWQSGISPLPRVPIPLDGSPCSGLAGRPSVLKSSLQSELPCECEGAGTSACQGHNSTTQTRRPRTVSAEGGSSESRGTAHWRGWAGHDTQLCSDMEGS